MPFGFQEKLLDVGRLRHIPSNRNGIDRILGPKFLGQFRGLVTQVYPSSFVLKVTDRNLRSLGRQSLAYRTPQATRAARDDGHLVLQIQVHCFVFFKKGKRESPVVLIRYIEYPITTRRRNRGAEQLVMPS